MGMSTKTKILLAIAGFIFYAVRGRHKKQAGAENFGPPD